MNSIFKIDESRFGLSIINRKIEFFAPKYLVDTAICNTKFEEIELLKKYIFILKSYANSKSENIFHYREQDNSESFDLIEAYINIISDYITNGDFFMFSKINNSTNKKINWSKTIKNNDIMIQNNNIMYGSFTSNDKKINHDDIFMNIYLSVLNDSSIIFLNNPLTKIELNINDNQAIYHINKYLDTHFKDREIFIAKQLKKIFESRKFSSLNEKIFDVKYHENFEYIFQFLVEQNVIEYSLPYNKKQGNYVNTNDLSKKNGMNLKLDHFIKFKNRYYILDSKYYLDNYINGTITNMPQTNDIIKQVGYKFYIAALNNIDIKSINNVFIFPSTEDSIDHFCNHIVEGDVLNHFYISCIRLNINNLIDNFISRKTNNDLLSFLDRIPI